MEQMGYQPLGVDLDQKNSDDHTALSSQNGADYDVYSENCKEDQVVQGVVSPPPPISGKIDITNQEGQSSLSKIEDNSKKTLKDLDLQAPEWAKK